MLCFNFCVFLLKHLFSLFCLEAEMKSRIFQNASLKRNRFPLGNVAFSTLKEYDILNTTCVFLYPLSIITGINLFCGKMLHLIGMSKMPFVIVPICLIEPMETLL